METKHSITETVEDDFDWEFFEYAAQLEKQWKQSLLRYTDKELLEIFPEAKPVIPLKIQEWKSERRKVVSIIKTKLRKVYQKCALEHQFFWAEIIKHLDGKRLMEINAHIARLQRQFAITQDRKPNGNHITDERIQRARETPLVDIACQMIKLRKAGKTFMGLCPFHTERHPSFYIYPQNNRFYCFGCQKGGDVITFVRETQGLSFREAVEYLGG